MLKVFTIAVLLICYITIGKNSVRQSQCKLDCQIDRKIVYYEYNILVGGIMQMYQEPFTIDNAYYTMKRRPNDKERFEADFQYLMHFLGFLAAIKEINKRSDLLPNISLGFELYDTSMTERRAIGSLLYMLSGSNVTVPNYRCTSKIVAAFIGHRLSSVTHALANLLGLYRYPQISYGSMDSSFNRLLFPSLFHTVPNQQMYFKAIILLLNHFGWSWVGIITSENDYYLSSSLELKEAITSSGACVEVIIPIGQATKKRENNFQKSKHDLARSSCNVFIINAEQTSFLSIYNLIQIVQSFARIYIIPPDLQILTKGIPSHIFQDSLGIAVQGRNIPNLRNLLLDGDVKTLEHSGIVTLLKRLDYYCLLPMINNTNCKISIKKMSIWAYNVDNIRITHRVYTAVYAVAHALHDMYLYSKVKDSGTQEPVLDWKPWQINQYLRKVHFNMPGGEEVYFDDEDSAFTKFDIIKYELQNKTNLKHVQVGQIYLNRTHGLQIKINYSDIKFNKVNASVCQNECSPGFRKAPVEGIHKCCFKCVPCSEGEISNSTGQENCWKCPEDHWSDMNKVQCVPRSIEFLSYQDLLGVALTLLALFFTALTITVLWIFITHRHTAIVKANNLTLSYTLLISLMLCFLSSLLFIGRPVNTTCRLRQAAFGIIFTVAVSCILAKTITVVLAFNALKPNSTLRKWLGNRIPVCLVPLCTLGVVLICIVWWIHSPPFQDSDTHTDHNKLILQCNEGSVTLFYAMISYFGFLAFFSFVVAFIARKLPDTFNEAQYITFSMLVFCSVWVTFIPAYLSTKGKYMVAVEVFTILASGAGLLGCIFIPKCYIVLIRPDLNSRVCLTN